MNVFILSTGRCGSTTFVRACGHANNYTSAHESRWGLLGSEHFAYPANHIEADNRLSWFLGSLERAFGDGAFYVHLRRNVHETANSFARRFDRGILKAYAQAMLARDPDPTEAMAIALDYCETVNCNIAAFLERKSRRMSFELEHARRDFPRFWSLIGAKGDLDAALAEWDTRHNASRGDDPGKPATLRAVRKLGRIARGLPGWLRSA